MSALVLLGGVVWFGQRGSRWIACGTQPVRVRGTLIEARAGEAIERAWVMALPNVTWANEPDTVERYRERGADFRSRADALAWTAPMCGSGFTRSDGTFDIVCGIPCSSTGGPLRPTKRSDATANDIEALRVEVDGRQPIVLPIREGQWTRHAQGRDVPPRDDVYATYDLGRITVEP